MIEEDKNGKESVSYKVIDSHSSRSKHLTIYDIPIDTASMKFEGLKRTGYSDELHEYYVISGPEHHAVVADELRVKAYGSCLLGKGAFSLALAIS